VGFGAEVVVVEVKKTREMTMTSRLHRSLLALTPHQPPTRFFLAFFLLPMSTSAPRPSLSEAVALIKTDPRQAEAALNAVLDSPAGGQLQLQPSSPSFLAFSLDPNVALLPVSAFDRLDDEDLLQDQQDALLRLGELYRDEA
jgi:hypothetical protein